MSATGLTGNGASPDDSDREAGLSEAEALRRMRERDDDGGAGTGRSYLSIVRANVLTVFNVILVAFGVVTLIFGDAIDALFLGVVVANSAIGITQEVKAKRALDRLSMLVSPHTMVIRDGHERRVPAAEVVVGDIMVLSPGDQVTADAEVISATDLRLDESILTGESEPTHRSAGDAVHSGVFVLEGTARCRATAVGAESFAARLTGQARSFRHRTSPLERAVNRLLYGMVVIVLVLGTVLSYSLHHRHIAMHAAISTASAGVVTLIPEGLMVLVSLTYAAAALRMSRRGVLAQQLNAIESLASVDTICVDKTGTLTAAALRVVELLPDHGSDEQRLTEALRTLVSASPSRNATLEAIATTIEPHPRTAIAAVPFSSSKRWSAVQVQEGSFYLGAPGRLPVGELADAAEERQRQGRRVLAVAFSNDALGAEPGDDPPAGLRPLGLVVLAEELRPNINDTIDFLLGQKIDIKVLSGDAPQTVAAIAGDVGIPVSGVAAGDAIPDEPEARLRFARETSVIGRISPEGKLAIVQALQEQGHYVAMLGDGVNDVPALKGARLAIAQGSGTQMARTVSDLILIDGDFAAVPQLIEEGRRALRNLQRVAKLYVTKSAFAAFLILTIGISSEHYPLLPRHISLAASLTVGIPTFFLALAPSTGPWRPDRFVRNTAQFAVPAGFVTGTGVVAGYLFAVHDLDLSVTAARTVALTTMVILGLYLVMALEAGGSRRRSSLVAAMCAVMAAIYLLVLLIPLGRRLFELSTLTPAVLGTAIGASATAIVAFMLCGVSLGTTSAQQP